MTLNELINKTVDFKESSNISDLPLFINGTTIDNINLELLNDCEGRHWVNMTFSKTCK